MSTISRGSQSEDTTLSANPSTGICIATISGVMMQTLLLCLPTVERRRLRDFPASFQADKCQVQLKLTLFFTALTNCVLQLLCCAGKNAEGHPPVLVLAAVSRKIHIKAISGKRRPHVAPRPRRLEKELHSVTSSDDTLVYGVTPPRVPSGATAPSLGCRPGVSFATGCYFTKRGLSGFSPQAGTHPLAGSA